MTGEPLRRSAGSILFWSSAFGLCMAFFEAAVVVYLFRLQELGQASPLSDPLSNRILLTEFLREAASIAMIASVACLATRGLVARFAIASVVFGLWDIFYYVFLRALSGFPEGLLTWDVLFLIPLPWVGPVLAPVCVSVVLVVAGAHSFLRQARGAALDPRPWHWAVAVVGAAVIIFSFTVDTPRDFDGTDFPDRFRWEIFLPGLALAVGAYVACARGRPGTPG